MTVLLWAVIALLCVAGAIVFAARQAARIAPALAVPPGEKLPATPTQRLVGRSLALGLIPMTVAAGLIARFGPTTYADDDAARLTVTGLLVASLLVLAAPQLLAGVWAARRDTRIDERDRGILAQAPTSQAAAMLVVLVVWVIALTERFWGEPGMPLEYLNLMFWSCLLVSLVAWNVGALLGYRRT